MSRPAGEAGLFLRGLESRGMLCLNEIFWSNGLRKYFFFGL